MSTVSDTELAKAEALIAEARAEPAPVAVADPSADAEAYIAAQLAALPPATTLSWANGLYRIATSATAVGEGKTIARAIRMIGATYEHVDGGRRILLDQSGEPIPAE